MEGRGGILPRQGQDEAGLLGFASHHRLPPGMSRLCRALARRTAGGIQAARRRRRLGSSLYDDELSGRGADRSRDLQIRRQRPSLSRLEAGHVERGRKDRAGRGGGRIRGPCQRHDLCGVPGRGRRRLSSHLDHHALDDSGKSRDRLLAPRRLWTLPGDGCAGRQLGQARRDLHPCAIARSERVRCGEGRRLRVSRRGHGRRTGLDGLRPSAARSRLRLCRSPARRRACDGRRRHGLRPHRARPRTRGFRALDGEHAPPSGARNRDAHSLYGRRERRLHRRGARFRRQARHHRQGQNRRRQQGGHRCADRGRDARRARQAQAPISAQLALEDAGDLPQYAAMVPGDGSAVRQRARRQDPSRHRGRRDRAHALGAAIGREPDQGHGDEQARLGSVPPARLGRAVIDLRPQGRSRNPVRRGGQRPHRRRLREGGRRRLVRSKARRSGSSARSTIPRLTTRSTIWSRSGSIRARRTPSCSRIPSIFLDWPVSAARSTAARTP